MARAKNVNEYIRNADPKARPMLRQLRSAIRFAAPKAEEKMSYSMPYYDYFGRLVYFAAFRDHVSLFAMMSTTTQAKYAAQLRLYQTGKATLQFPLGVKLPMTLIQKLVRQRVQENRMRAGRGLAPIQVGEKK